MRRYGYFQHWLAEKWISHRTSDGKSLQKTANMPFSGNQHFWTANRLSLLMSKQQVIFLLVLNTAQRFFKPAK